LSDNTQFDELAVKVVIKGIPLWHETHKINKSYTDTFEYDLKWAVPSIAPHGTYDITVTASGNGGGTKGTVMCVKAKMELWNLCFLFINLKLSQYFGI